MQTDKPVSKRKRIYGTNVFDFILQKNKRPKNVKTISNKMEQGT